MYRQATKVASEMKSLGLVVVQHAAKMSPRRDDGQKRGKNFVTSKALVYTTGRNLILTGGIFN